MVACQKCRDLKRRCSLTHGPQQAKCDHCTERGWACTPATSRSRPATRSRVSKPPSATPITSKHPAPLQLLDQTRRVTKVLIAIDFGTQATKAVYKLIRLCDKQEPRVLQDLTVMRGFEPITWSGGAGESPTQVAFVKNEHGRVVPVWGAEVDRLLSAGKVSEQHVLRWLKATVFDSSGGAAELFHNHRLTQRLAELKKFHASDSVMQMATPFSIWALYLNLAFGFVLRKIKEKVGTDLPWSTPGHPKDAYMVDFESLENLGVRVEVALPVPAGLEVKLCHRALRAAKEAGIPNCYIVAEPASVAAFVAQEDFENHPAAPDTRPTLFVDNGSGTIDLTLTSIADSGNSTHDDTKLCLQERVAGKMSWSGAGFVNEAFRQMIHDEVNVAQVIEYMNSTPGLQVAHTAEDWIAMLEREFEQQKKLFDGTYDIRLRAPYTPRRNFGKIRLSDDTLIIPAGTLKELFATCLESTFHLIDQQIDAYSVICHVGRRALDIKRLCLAGGGNENEYVRKAIVERYQQNYEVIRPSSSTKAKMMTVTGALLLLLDKPFVGQRIARRGYCFVRDDFKTKSWYEKGSLWFDPMYNEMMVKDTVKFVLRVGDIVRSGYEQRLRGNRGLYLDEDTGTGWEIEEGLWCTDDPAACKDGLWVFSCKHQFIEAGTIHFQLVAEDASSFEVKTDCNGRLFYHLEYEVVFTLDGLDVCFEIVIPKSGRFEEDLGRTRELIKRRARLDDSFMYELHVSSQVKRSHSKREIADT